MARNIDLLSSSTPNLFSNASVNGHVAYVVRHHSRWHCGRSPTPAFFSNACLVQQQLQCSAFRNSNGCLCLQARGRLNVLGQGERRGAEYPNNSQNAIHSPFFHASLGVARATSYVNDVEDDSDSDSESESGPVAAEHQQINPLKEDANPSFGGFSTYSKPEDKTHVDDGDFSSMASKLPLIGPYVPHGLLEFVTKKLMFWSKKNLLEGTPYDSLVSGEGNDISSIHQWTATELDLQRAQLKRISRDVFYLVISCCLLGFVRILEAFHAAFSSKPHHLSKLLDIGNSFDFFTIAFLAYRVRRPIVAILGVDPTDLNEVVYLKAKIWDKMHKFYESQWRLVNFLPKKSFSLLHGGLILLVFKHFALY
ncbi:hypothetical protein KP509_17G073800 [Ceratopteris richardii]|uniref:Uncharacterized protein n=1 Tax=Ceratopteris richardii TaxID=49495 RepID=A0A8T2SZH0_CERRI|nr:hypothetical protein KP509_17G073800 [Ceratopteris richardii]